MASGRAVNARLERPAHTLRVADFGAVPPPEIRIKLERVDVCARVTQDPLLSTSELVRRAGVELLRAGTAMRFGERATIFHQGERGDSIFFIIGGHVRLYAAAQSEGV